MKNRPNIVKTCLKLKYLLSLKSSMIVIQVKKGESIDRALKRYKYKVIKTKQIEQLREKQQFVKKSVRKREQKQKAIYKQSLNLNDD